MIPNEYTFKLCSIFQQFPWWLHGSEHPVYSLCSLQTYIMYLIKYLAITIYFSVMSNKLLPYHLLGHWFNINVTLFTIIYSTTFLSCIEVAQAIMYINELPMFACNL